MSSKGGTRSQILGSALTLLRESTGLTMAEVAARAGLSRQAVYLHFQDRTSLLLALARQAEEELPDSLAVIARAPSARAAVTALVTLAASANPGFWPVARILDGLRATDAAVDAAWQDRLTQWLDACRAIAQRFQAEGALARHMSLEAAADLLSSLTSLRLWEELVIGRGWSAERYRRHVTYLAVGALTH